MEIPIASRNLDATRTIIELKCGAKFTSPRVHVLYLLPMYWTSKLSRFGESPSSGDFAAQRLWGSGKRNRTPLFFFPMGAVFFAGTLGIIGTVDSDFPAEQ
jgi:hypothetical protein